MPTFTRLRYPSGKTDDGVGVGLYLFFSEAGKDQRSGRERCVGGASGTESGAVGREGGLAQKNARSRGTIHEETPG